MRGEQFLSSSGDPPPPNAWRQKIAPSWNGPPKGASLVPISRVNQLDAERLDIELTGMLREQLLRVFTFMQPSFLSRYEPELNAFLEFLIWRFSVWLDRPTPGNALMNLRFRDERAIQNLVAAGKVKTGLEGPGLSKSQKLLYCLALVGGRYGWARLQMISAFQRWGDNDRGSWARKAWVLLQRAETLYRLAGFVNILVFLRTGRYRNIIERLLKTRLVYSRANMNRAVSFEYMNRQLVWHEFSELLLLMLPLLNFISLKKVLSFSFLNNSSSSSSSRSKEDGCPVCEACPITVPYVALPCEHQHCYFCISTRSIGNSSYRCKRCNMNVVAIRRHHPQLALNTSEQKGKSKS